MVYSRHYVKFLGDICWSYSDSFTKKVIYESQGFLKVMRYDGFTESDILEEGLIFMGDLNKIDSMPCWRTRDYRIDPETPDFDIHSEHAIPYSREREARIQAHTLRVQRELCGVC